MWVEAEALASQNIFSQYIEKPSIFRDKKTLTSTFIPDRIPHREHEINQLSVILAPILRGYRANNVFLYGTCGTGKTICTRFVVSQLMAACEKGGISAKSIYVNCKMKKVADTEYRLIAQLVREFGGEVPDTGLPTDVLYRMFFDKVDGSSQNIILVLDEIDALLRKVGDEFLYNFTRINDDLKKSCINVIGITNDLSIRDAMDMRVKSSLSEEEMIFKPYNAMQLKDILKGRANGGFVEGAVDDFVLNKCAAIAAQEHGDARRALDLLRVAGEIAERNGELKVGEEHVDVAEAKIDMDRITETMRAQPKHSQAVMFSIIKIHDSMDERGKEKWTDSRLLTGDVFAAYEQICRQNNMKCLTQRRLSDLIGELDMLGIINANVISKGRYGRTREISIAVSEAILGKVRSFLAGRFE